MQEQSGTKEPQTCLSREAMPAVDGWSVGLRGTTELQLPSHHNKCEQTTFITECLYDINKRLALLSFPPSGLPFLPLLGLSQHSTFETLPQPLLTPESASRLYFSTFTHHRRQVNQPAQTNSATATRPEPVFQKPILIYPK